MANGFYRKEELKQIDEKEALNIMAKNPEGLSSKPFVAYFSQNYYTFATIINCEILKGSELLDIFIHYNLYTQKEGII